LCKNSPIKQKVVVWYFASDFCSKRGNQVKQIMRLAGRSSKCINLALKSITTAAFQILFNSSFTIILSADGAE
jgi:hypothetical protein